MIVIEPMYVDLSGLGERVFPEGYRATRLRPRARLRRLVQESSRRVDPRSRITGADMARLMAARQRAQAALRARRQYVPVDRARQRWRVAQSRARHQGRMRAIMRAARWR